MKKLAMVDELINQGKSAMETGATLTKLQTSVECVVETVEFVDDVSKCVGSVNIILFLVALGAQGVPTFVEAHRKRRVLPIALGQIVRLQGYLLKGLIEITKHSRIEKELDNGERRILICSGEKACFLKCMLAVQQT